MPRVVLWIALAKLGVHPDLVYLIKSFHEDMVATVRVAGGCSEPIQVRNGLRQGCVMAPVLFNLYFAIVLERFHELLSRLHPESGVGLHVNINGNLFPRSTRHSQIPNDRISDLEYADDGMLCKSTRDMAALALSTFNVAATEFGFSVNFKKTKILVAGYGIVPGDCDNIMVRGLAVEHVSSFVYFGSVLTANARSSADIRRRLAQASSAFGSLREVLDDDKLSIATRRQLYNACVHSVLLYGSKCWTPLSSDLRHLDAFHHQCQRIILKISTEEQKCTRLTSAQLRSQFGDEKSVAEKVRSRQLEWLGHVARMPDNGIPKHLLFAALPAVRPAYGPRLRWKDVAHRHLSAAGHAKDWFKLAVDRRCWREEIVNIGIPPSLTDSVICEVCSRSFRRPSDMKRHKCVAERCLPLPMQRGSRQCGTCSLWFASVGGLTVHRCPGAQSASASSLCPRSVPS